MSLLTQRRLASKILKVGTNKIWFDPEVTEDIEAAVTRDDVRALISDGNISVKPVVGTSRGRARKIALQKAKGRRRGQGSRKGAKGARFPRKKRWMVTIRAVRKELTSLRESGEIESSTYRRLYLLAKGGTFKSRAHLKHYIKEQGFIKG